MVETTTTAAPAAEFVRIEAAGHVDCATLLPVRTAAAAEAAGSWSAGSISVGYSSCCVG
jgi:hypothetical protein